MLLQKKPAKPREELEKECWWWAVEEGGGGGGDVNEVLFLKPQNAVVVVELELLFRLQVLLFCVVVNNLLIDWRRVARLLLATPDVGADVEHKYELLAVAGPVAQTLADEMAEDIKHDDVEAALFNDAEKWFCSWRSWEGRWWWLYDDEDVCNLRLAIDEEKEKCWGSSAAAAVDEVDEQAFRVVRVGLVMTLVVCVAHSQSQLHTGDTDDDNKS